MADLRLVTFRKYRHIDFIRKQKPPVRLGIHKTLITPLLKVCFRSCRLRTKSRCGLYRRKRTLKPRPARPDRKFFPLSCKSALTRRSGRIVFEKSFDQSPGVGDGNRWAAARLSLLNWCETRREEAQLIDHSNYGQSDGPIKYRHLN